jgi:hypothetical protein
MELVIKKSLIYTFFMDISTYRVERSQRCHFLRNSYSVYVVIGGWNVKTCSVE